MRAMRKICLTDHLTKAGLPLEEGLAKEKYATGAGAPSVETTEAGDAYNEYKDVYSNAPDALTTMGAVYLISEKNTATTVLRKIDIKQVNDEWTIHLDDKPPASDASAAAPAAAASDKASQLQEENLNTIKVIDIYYECLEKANLCNVKDYLKGIDKVVSTATMVKINDMIIKFKGSIKSEKLNPKTFDYVFVIQERSNSTHTTKT
jgi:hypothetical protein